MMNQKGFIPIVLVIIGVLLGASIAVGIIEYGDKITAGVSRVFEGGGAIAPTVDVEPAESQPEDDNQAGPPKSESFDGEPVQSKPQPKPKPTPPPAPAPEPEPELPPEGVPSSDGTDGTPSDDGAEPAGSSDPAPAGEPECTFDTDCDDENQCTQDTCTNNICYNSCSVNQNCDDGDELTVNDKCNAWQSGCVCRGIPIECQNNSDCDDDDSGTIDSCNNAGTEDAVCSYSTITSCINDDGFCPSACDATEDSDCEPVCGNEICESGEDEDSCSADCEPELPQCKDGVDNDEDGKTDHSGDNPDPGCESPWDDDETDVIACYDHADCMTNPCEVYFCDNPGTAEAVCVFEDTITACYEDGYGCCPSGCTLATDLDCQ